MADNEINIVITATDKAANIIAGIGKALGGISSSVSKLTNEYIAYGDQVKSLSLFTGMQADETSRLIQLADDAFVSFETLRMSARLLADKGIAPTTENLAKLSDAYLALAPGVERSQFLLDNFGRAGIEMGKIMELGGEKVRSMSASIEDGLIIDQKKLESITATKQALDQFNDSLQAMRFEAAGQLLQIFQGLPKPLQDTVLAVGMLTTPQMLNNLSSFLIILNNIGGAKAAITGAATAMKGLAISTWAAIGPFLAVAAAITATGIAVYKLVQFTAMLISMFNQAAKNGKFWQFLTALTPMNIAREVFKAEGGPVSGGSPYIVGERGPELFVPSSSGRIIPNGGMSGGGTVVINYQPMLSLADRFELETKLRPIIQNAMRGA